MINPEIKQQLDEIKEFLILLHNEVEYKDECLSFDNYYAICDLVAKWEKEIKVNENSN